MIKILLLGFSVTKFSQINYNQYSRKTQDPVDAV